jgi:hypothetical protein
MTESTKNGDYGIKGHRKSPFGLYFIFACFVLSNIQKLYNFKKRVSIRGPFLLLEEELMCMSSDQVDNRGDPYLINS